MGSNKTQSMVNSGDHNTRGSHVEQISQNNWQHPDENSAISDMEWVSQNE